MWNRDSEYICCKIRSWSQYAKDIVKKNGFEDKITIIKGKVEEIELPVQQVDIIVSEWMGYFLIYESMLDTVIFARDKWLKKDKGYIYPDIYRMYMAGFQDRTQYKNSKSQFWNDIYGINMDQIGYLVYVEPSIETVEKEAIVTDVCTFFEIDLNTCKKDDAIFANQYTIKMLKGEKIDGIVTWFDVEFRKGLEKIYRFTTGPFSTQTHWKQTIFYIDGEYDLEVGDELYGSIAVRKNKKHPRELDIKFSFNTRDKFGEQLSERYIQYFQMT
ncbi:protein arginine n-methyltransferase [Stylonychia lemnae]|uniref:Protein arginine n-methyltransferase n=1 Tax=Stylonychia lemnae TaxID=5949 RepID=A0A078A5E7_STYLE|nr:protein arginine n-methyltransferase [Stylonychia lemnae]|eukprot:CDW77394.1 protein arginine n-methyltransferase [Stylonychia lemnae]